MKKGKGGRRSICEGKEKNKRRSKKEKNGEEEQRQSN